MAKAKEDPRAGVRITNQFRRGGSMVYDLAFEDVRLTLELTERPNEDGSGAWSIEGHTRQATDTEKLLELGVTRGEALTALAKSWAAKHGAIGFPRMDWDGVSEAMRGVRAI